MLNILKELFRRVMGEANLKDLINTSRHPKSFYGVRGQYINSRVQALALLFCILTTIWIPVDYFILPDGIFAPIAVARIAFSTSLFLLWRTTLKSYNLVKVRQRLLALMLLPSAFHLITQSYLEPHYQYGILISYTFLPFLIIAMHCIFPLTLLEGIGLAVTTIFVLSMEDAAASYSLLDIEFISKVWLLSLLMGIALWAQLSQLHFQLKLHREGIYDPLTQLLNRRTLNVHMDNEFDRAKRYQRELTAVLVDIDHFKKINDNYGHLAGDEVLSRFGEMIKLHLRDVDVCGRYGGEEFLLLLPETSVNAAEQVCQRLLEEFHQNNITLDNGSTVTVTASFGIAGIACADKVSELIDKADNALYQAKKSGRDQYVTHCSDEPAPSRLSNVQ